MKKPVYIVAALLALMGATCAWAGLFSDSWRYKMTVTVETPEGLKTGSAVREVTVKKGLGLTPQMRPDVEVKGEAVVVDLGQHGVLFALMKNDFFGPDYGKYVFFNTFPGEKKTGKVILPPNQYPLFARFKDISDPKTAENVVKKEDIATVHNLDPRRPIVDFEGAFGSGVSIKEVVIEITNDSVTREIEKYLPWLARVYGYISGRHADGREWYQQLDSGDFERKPR
jgi:hypothetical protein